MAETPGDHLETEDPFAIVGDGLASGPGLFAAAYVIACALAELAGRSVTERLDQMVDLAGKSGRVRDLSRSALEQVSVMGPDEWKQFMADALMGAAQLEDASDGNILLQRLGWPGSMDDFAERVHPLVKSVFEGFATNGTIEIDLGSLDPDLTQFFVRAARSFLRFLEKRYGRLVEYPESFGLAEYIQGKYEWGGNRSEAVELLWVVLRARLERLLHRLTIPGSRVELYEDGGLGNDSPMRFHDDEAQIVSIGLFQGLEHVITSNLTDFLTEPEKLGPTLTKAARNELIDEMRKANRRLGIRVPDKIGTDGESDAETMKRVVDDTEGLRGKEVLDLDIETDEGTTSLLGKAIDYQASRGYQEEEAEEQRPPMEEGQLAELAERAGLTRRQKLMTELWARSDEEVAIAMEETFGRPVTPGTIRKLRHDTRRKLKKAGGT